MVYKKNNGDVFIFDWKRSTKLVDQQGNLLLKDFKYGLQGLSHVEDNSFNRYALQQNVYKYILESNYGAKVSLANLLVLHPDYKDFVHLTVPDMQKEAKYLIEQAIELRDNLTEKLDPYAALRFREFNIFLVIRFILVLSSSMQLYNS